MTVRLGVLVLLAGCAFSHGRIYDAGVGVGCHPGVAEAAGRDAAGDATGDPTVSDGRVRWLRATGARDRELGGAWCETVGAPVVWPTPVLRSTPPSAGDSLVVLSWNMNVGGGDLAGLLRDEVGIECAPRGGGEPAASGPVPAFVLLVQEAHRRSEGLPPARPGPKIPRTIDPDAASPDGPDIVELARRCGLAMVYVPSMRNGPDGGSRPQEDKGNAVLSNVPLEAPAAIELPFETYRRVAAAAVLRPFGGAPLRVVSVHFDVVGLPFRMLLSGNQARTRQARGFVEALDLLDQRSPADAGVVVGADLNTWSAGEAARRLIGRAFPDSPPDDGRATRGPFPTDHIFFRRGSGALRAEGYRVIEESHGSDHRGRALRLTRARGDALP